MELLPQLHLLRPWWLLALLPALLITIYLWRRKSSGANWRRAIAPELLEHLLDRHSERQHRWPWLVLLAGWCIAALALAGPTWEKLPQPVVQQRDALVIVLDLSLSMYAQDVKPSRLQRARYKLLDILNRRHEGVTGLVAYSGDAHVVAPLTDDTATVANLVPALAPDMMPIYGSNPVAGVEQALTLMRNAGFERGRILLVSDEIGESDVDTIAKAIKSGAWQLSLLGIGTQQGAPIPLPVQQPQGVFMKQENGSIAVAQLHRERFENLARQSNGRYSDVRLDDSDLDALLPSVSIEENDTRTVQREFDQWRERGPQLVMLLLPLAALAFRRGWLLLLLLIPFSLPSQAQNWQEQWRDLWSRPDQQGQQALKAGDAATAAQKFQDPAWRGSALYRAGDYAGAAQNFQQVDNAEAQYNRGNALAHAGQLQEAIAAYDTALKKNPNLEDAKTNRALVEKLLQQQKQNPQPQSQQSPPQKNEQGQQQQNQSSDQQNQQQAGSDQKNKSDQQQSGNNTNTQQQDQSQQPAGGKSAEDKKSEAQQQQAQAGKEHDKEQNAKEQQQANAAQQEKDRQQQQQNGQMAQQPEDQAQSDKQNAAMPGTADAQQQREQQATEQWLRQIPDDPSGLLRRKFNYEHRQRARAGTARDSDQPLW